MYLNYIYIYIYICVCVYGACVRACSCLSFHAIHFPKKIYSSSLGAGYERGVNIFKFLMSPI